MGKCMSFVWCILLNREEDSEPENHIQNVAKKCRKEKRTSSHKIEASAIVVVVLVDFNKA